MSLYKNLSFDPQLQNRRRSDLAVPSRALRSAFARRQYACQSAYVYNKINRFLNLYPMTLHDCKASISKWLSGLKYEEVEKVITRVT